MFNRNKKGGDGVRKSIQKLLDPKRDSDKRLSNLRHIIDNAQEIADQQVSLFSLFFADIFCFSSYSANFIRIYFTFFMKIFYWSSKNWNRKIRASEPLMI